MFPDDIILYVEDPKDVTLPKKLCIKTNKFSKVTRQKTHINQVYFNMLISKIQKGNFKNNTIYSNSKRNKHLRINLTKELKDLYTEN